MNLQHSAPSWATDTLPLRACCLCDWGRDLATEPQDWGRLCRHPEVIGRVHPKPTDPVRATGGACGPEATFLTIRGVQL